MRRRKAFAPPAAFAWRRDMRQHLQVGSRGSAVGIAAPRSGGQVGGEALYKAESFNVSASKRKPHGERLGAQRLPILDRKNHVQAYVGGEFHLGAGHQTRQSAVAILLLLV